MGMLQADAAKLDQFLIPESCITPSQYQDSCKGNQVRLTEEQRLIVALLADGIMAFKDFFQRAEVMRWVNSDQLTPNKNLPFLFCIAALGLEIEPPISRAIYLDKCRHYTPTVIRTLSPIQVIAPRTRQERAMRLSA